MPDLNEFLGKDKKKIPDFIGWEKQYGVYGCKECKLDSDTAYFNEDSYQLKWVCPDGHVSMVQLD
jgi:hypothetical protein